MSDMFTITTTPKGWIRVETRFQRIGTYKTMTRAMESMAEEVARREHFRKATEGKCSSYESYMSAAIKAEQDWQSNKR